MAWGSGENASKLLSGFSGMKLRQLSLVLTIHGYSYKFSLRPETDGKCLKP